MVIRLTSFFSLLSLCLFSGEFIASVTQNQVHLQESLTLQLTLKDVSAKGMPSINALRKSFLIHSQQQSSNMVITNGKASSSTTWKFVLSPQEVGDLQIPSISISTSEGELVTEPIEIHVLEGESFVDAESSDVEGITFTAEISNASPYKNEPVVYTVKLVSERLLANIQMQKIEVEDAIVEANGEPKIYDKVIKGIRVDVVEFSYVITPLKAGILKIPAALLQAGIPSQPKKRGGLFDNSFDPFMMMRSFDHLQPIVLRTKETTLDVQPMVPGITPWLPARSVKIEEEWKEPSSLQAGDPFTRSFMISVDGVRSDQIPSLHDQFSNGLFKVYNDVPELKDTVKNGKVFSSRKEQYTFVPEKSGDLTMPEISLSWWDVEKKEKCIASIPPRTIHVLPAPVKALQNGIDSAQGTQVVIVQKDPILYFILAGAGVLLITAILWGFMLQQRLSRLSETPETTDNPKVVEEPIEQAPVKKKKDKKEKLPDLNPT